MSTQPALFELDQPRPAPVPGDDLTHVLMPCMGYACGESILTVRGHFVMGVYLEKDWDAIDCPQCRACGRDEIRAEMGRQQGRQAGAA